MVSAALTSLEEAPHLGVELLGIGGERFGERLHLVGGGARIGARAGDAGHRLGAGARLGGCAVDALGDGRDRGVLLLDGGGDRAPRCRTSRR